MRICGGAVRGVGCRGSLSSEKRRNTSAADSGRRSDESRLLEVIKVLFLETASSVGYASIRLSCVRVEWRERARMDEGQEIEGPVCRWQRFGRGPRIFKVSQDA